MKKALKFSFSALIFAFSSANGMFLENMFNLAGSKTCTGWRTLPEGYEPKASEAEIKKVVKKTENEILNLVTEEYNKDGTTKRRIKVMNPEATMEKIRGIINKTKISEKIEEEISLHLIEQGLEIITAASDYVKKSATVSNKVYKFLTSAQTNLTSRLTTVENKRKFLTANDAKIIPECKNFAQIARDWIELTPTLSKIASFIHVYDTSNPHYTTENFEKSFVTLVLDYLQHNKMLPYPQKEIENIKKLLPSLKKLCNIFEVSNVDITILDILGRSEDELITRNWATPHDKNKYLDTINRFVKNTYELSLIDKTRELVVKILSTYKDYEQKVENEAANISKQLETLELTENIEELEEGIEKLKGRLSSYQELMVEYENENFSKIDQTINDNIILSLKRIAGKPRAKYQDMCNHRSKLADKLEDLKRKASYENSWEGKIDKMSTEDVKNMPLSDVSDAIRNGVVRNALMQLSQGDDLSKDDALKLVNGILDKIKKTNYRDTICDTITPELIEKVVIDSIPATLQYIKSNIRGQYINPVDKKVADYAYVTDTNEFGDIKEFVSKAVEESGWSGNLEDISDAQYESQVHPALLKQLNKTIMSRLKLKKHILERLKSGEEYCETLSGSLKEAETSMVPCVRVNTQFDTAIVASSSKKIGKLCLGVDENSPTGKISTEAVNVEISGKLYKLENCYYQDGYIWSKNEGIGAPTKVEIISRLGKKLGRLKRMMKSEVNSVKTGGDIISIFVKHMTDHKLVSLFCDSVFIKIFNDYLKDIVNKRIGAEKRKNIMDDRKKTLEGRKQKAVQQKKRLEEAHGRQTEIDRCQHQIDEIEKKIAQLKPTVSELQKKLEKIQVLIKRTEEL